MREIDQGETKATGCEGDVELSTARARKWDDHNGSEIRDDQDHGNLVNNNVRARNIEHTSGNSEESAKNTIGDADEVSNESEKNNDDGKEEGVRFSMTEGEPKVVELNGLSMRWISSAAFLIYVIWAISPGNVLHYFGIYYYPSRWWALAIPSWIVMAIFYVYVALACYNIEYLTLPLNSVENLADEAECLAYVTHEGKIGRLKPVTESTTCRITEHSRSTTVQVSTDVSQVKDWGVDRCKLNEIDWHALWSKGTDAVLDIPMGGVCQVLYG